MQREQDTYANEEASPQNQHIWENIPSYVERFREGRSSFKAEANQFTQTFCGLCGFWVDGQHQCPPVQDQSVARGDEVQSAPRQLTAFCQTCPDPDEVTQMLQDVGFHLVFSMPAEEDGDSMGLPPLPAQFHYEDEFGTRVEFLAGEDIPSLADDGEEDAASVLPVRYPPHNSRFWLTAGGQALAMRRTREALAQRWALHWLDERTIEAMEAAA